MSEEGKRYQVRWRWRPKGSHLWVHEKTELRASDCHEARATVVAQLAERHPRAEITRVYRVRKRPLTGPHALRPDGPEAA